ncbi:hypothetical protein SK128_020438, partial [Halocaridina rubra]
MIWAAFFAAEGVKTPKKVHLQNKPKGFTVENGCNVTGREASRDSLGIVLEDEKEKVQRGKVRQHDEARHSSDGVSPWITSYAGK